MSGDVVARARDLLEGTDEAPLTIHLASADEIIGALTGLIEELELQTSLQGLSVQIPEYGEWGSETLLYLFQDFGIQPGDGYQEASSRQGDLLRSLAAANAEVEKLRGADEHRKTCAEPCCRPGSEGRYGGCVTSYQTLYRREQQTSADLRHQIDEANQELNLQGELLRRNGLDSGRDAFVDELAAISLHNGLNARHQEDARQGVVHLVHDSKKAIERGVAADAVLPVLWKSLLALNDRMKNGPTMQDCREKVRASRSGAGTAQSHRSPSRLGVQPQISQPATPHQAHESTVVVCGSDSSGASAHDRVIEDGPGLGSAVDQVECSGPVGVALNDGEHAFHAGVAAVADELSTVVVDEAAGVGEHCGRAGFECCEHDENLPCVNTRVNTPCGAE